MAMRRMAQSKLNLLPVVGRENIRDLKGVVSLSDILQAYGVTEKKGHAQEASKQILPSRRLVPGVIAAGLAVVLVIGFLNYYYRSARSQRAAEYYKTGNEFLQQDRDDEAVQQFRDALSGAPGNADYRLALGLALAKADHPAEASVYLNALLKRDPENALANLAEARIAAAQHKTADAVKLYHRAIDGSWPQGQGQNRMQARFELAALLEKTGQKTQAVAELLAAAGSAPRDIATKNKIGQTLLGYGATREATDVFREVIRTDDRNPDAYAGLGSAEIALENYEEARDAFRKALQWNPTDDSSKKQLDLIESVLALDPNARGLRVAERYQRSKELLQAEVMRIGQCQPGNQASEAAQKALTIHPRRNELEDAAEMNLSLARDLWKQEQKLCRTALGANDATERVLALLSK
jgi:tetratricopeptide (TPR) repeat protein